MMNHCKDDETGDEVYWTAKKGTPIYDGDTDNILGYLGEPTSVKINAENKITEIAAGEFAVVQDPAESERASEYDIISRPSHYEAGRKYAPKDVIRDWGLNYNLGSAVKYLARAGRKDAIINDLEKARTFIQFEIEALAEEGEEEES